MTSTRHTPAAVCRAGRPVCTGLARLLQVHRSCRAAGKVGKTCMTSHIERTPGQAQEHGGPGLLLCGAGLSNHCFDHNEGTVHETLRWVSTERCPCVG